MCPITHRLVCNSHVGTCIAIAAFTQCVNCRRRRALQGRAEKGRAVQGRAEKGSLGVVSSDAFTCI